MAEWNYQTERRGFKIYVHVGKPLKLRYIAIDVTDTTAYCYFAKLKPPVNQPTTAELENLADKAFAEFLDWIVDKLDRDDP